MIKVSIMYPNTPGTRFDHGYYRDKHLPLISVKQISEVVVENSAAVAATPSR